MTTISEIDNNTIPIYHIIILPERFNWALLHKTKLKMKENEVFMKKLNIIT